MTLQNEKFEELIAAQLTRALEPQRGRAAAAFQAQLAEESRRAADERGIAGGSPHQESWAQRSVSRHALWLWTGVPALAAAALALVLTLQFVHAPVAPTNGGQTAQTSISGATGGGQLAGTSVDNTLHRGGMLTSKVEITQNQPGGVILQNNQPVRMIHQQTLRTTEWIDPRDNAHYTLTEEPTETTVPLPVQPY